MEIKLTERPDQYSTMALVGAYLGGMPVAKHALPQGHIYAALLDNHGRLTPVGVALVEQALADEAFAAQDWVQRAVAEAKRRAEPEMPDLAALAAESVVKGIHQRLALMAENHYARVFWQAYYTGASNYFHQGQLLSMAETAPIAAEYVAAGKAPTPEDVGLVRGHVPYRFSFSTPIGRKEFEAMVGALSPQLGFPYIGNTGIYVATVTPYVADPLAVEPTPGWLTTLEAVAKALKGKRLPN